jgi:hypothetical protein
VTKKNRKHTHNKPRIIEGLTDLLRVCSGTYTSMATSWDFKVLLEEVIPGISHPESYEKIEFKKERSCVEK